MYCSKWFNPLICLLFETQVAFHFVTKLTDEAGTIIDDSRKMGKPMELVLGKKFKLEVWETIVQLMSLNEVASFTVDRSVSGIVSIRCLLLCYVCPPLDVQTMLLVRISLCCHTHLLPKPWETWRNQPRKRSITVVEWHYRMRGSAMMT